MILRKEMDTPISTKRTHPYGRRRLGKRMANELRALSIYISVCFIYANVTNYFI